MELNNVIDQRRKFMEILQRGNEVFSKYKVDFDYINNSTKHIQDIEKKYKFDWKKGLFLVIASMIIGAILRPVTIIDISIILMIIAFVTVPKKFKVTLEEKRNKVLNEVSRRFALLKKKHEEFEYKDFLHIKYASPDIIAVLHSYLEEGRADDLKEAINLMHTENQANEMLKKQEEILNGLNSASKTNAVLGVATIAAVVLSGAATRQTIRN